MNEKYGQVKGKIQDFSGHARERFDRLADDLRRRAGEGAEEFRHRMGQAGSGCSSTVMSGQQGLHKVRARIRAAVEEQPFAMGLLFFSLGAAAGAILPVSRRETRVMGKKREEVLARAEEMAREQLEEVGEVVREAGAAAEAEVKRRLQGGAAEAEQSRDKEPAL